jgi:hypothetical protein
LLPFLAAKKNTIYVSSIVLMIYEASSFPLNNVSAPLDCVSIKAITAYLVTPLNFLFLSPFP